MANIDKVTASSSLTSNNVSQANYGTVSAGENPSHEAFYISPEDYISPEGSISMEVEEANPQAYPAGGVLDYDPECMSRPKNQLLSSAVLMGVGFFGGVIYSLGHGGIRKHSLEGEMPIDDKTSVFLTNVIMCGFVGMAAMALMSFILWTHYNCNESSCCARARPGR